MTGTLLDAILVYACLEKKQLGDVYSSEIEINQVGERLEYFVKDLICDSFDASSKETKDERHVEYLSWLGAQNHPPDMMIRQGEAIEVKKSKGKHPNLALNSSPPRQVLRSDDSRVIAECRDAEDWSEKDMVYAIGSQVSKNKLGFMWMVYGDCWCDSDESYLEISDTITEKAVEGLSNIDDIELDTDSNELGKVHKADSLGRTKLRVRGMWSLEHPAKHFKQYVEDYEEKISGFQPLFVVMTESRYEEFPESVRLEVENHPNISCKHISSPNPSDPEEELGCMLIEAT